MSAPLEPDRLARLSDEPDGNARPPADALDSIRRGARRRRIVHRAAAAPAAIAILAGRAIACDAVRGASVPTGPAARLTPELVHSASPTKHVQRPSGGLDWDIDGDGRQDTARIVPLGKGDHNTRFLLIVRMTRLGTQRIQFTAAPAIKVPPTGPRIAGSVDADSDGHAEIFVMIDSGASTQTWTIFKVINRRVTQVSAAGNPARISVGGTVMDNSGFSCRQPAGALVTYSYGAVSSGAGSQKWDIQRDTYRWAGSRLVLVSKRTRTLPASASRAQLANYAGVRCGDLPQFSAP